MSIKGRQDVVIVDYGLGNLFSIKQACRSVGLEAEVASSKKAILDAGAVILPGVGAFGDAMDALRRLDLEGPIREIAGSGRPLVGICLGLQLLFTRSYEFGTHLGLDIIKGEVVRFEAPQGPQGQLKVPQVCWNRIYAPTEPFSGVEGSQGASRWNGSLLEGLENGTYVYFVHSFYGIPEDSSVILSKTTYGHIEFCSGLRKGNIHAFQFHPERSGQRGINLYRNLYRLLKDE